MPFECTKFLSQCCSTMVTLILLPCDDAARRPRFQRPVKLAGVSLPMMYCMPGVLGSGWALCGYAGKSSAYLGSSSGGVIRVRVMGACLILANSSRLISSPAHTATHYCTSHTSLF